MPNWTPSEDHIRRLQEIVHQLTNRRATMMEEDYPLTFDQLQAVVTPPRLSEFMQLGYDSMQHLRNVSYELGPEHGLQRRAVTNVHLPKNIPYAFSSQQRNNYVEGIPIYFNRDAIDDTAMKKLIEWTEKALYERRLAMLTVITVKEFFQHMSNDPASGRTRELSMYHIMARWPGLRVVFPRTSYNGRGGDMWERHGNGVPRNLQRWAWPAYGPEAEWREKSRARMALAEETLLSCVSLSTGERPKPPGWPRNLTAKLTDWQKLGGTPF